MRNWQHFLKKVPPGLSRFLRGSDEDEKPLLTMLMTSPLLTMRKLAALTFTGIAALTFTGTAAAEAVAQRWATLINGTSSGNDVQNAVAVDAAGDVYSCGSVRNTGTSGDFHVVKYSGATGAVLWRYSRHGGSGDEARRVCVAPDGSIYAAGIVENFVATFSDIYLVKLNPTTGAMVWETGWGNNSIDSVSDMAVDSAGNVLLTAYYPNSAATQTIFKVSSAGSQMWMTKIRDRIGSEVGHNVNLVRVVVDSQDNVIIGGAADFWGIGYELYVTKLSASAGGRLWEWHGGTNVSSGGGGTGELAVNFNDDVIINGLNFGGYGHLGGSGMDAMTAKINGTTGSEVWRNTYDFGVGGAETEGAVAIDPNGDVYVTGGSNQTYSGGDSQVFTRKINGYDGESMWTVRHPGSGLFGRDIAFTAQGDVLALDSNAHLFKYAGGNGTIKWEASYGVNGNSSVGRSLETLALRPDSSAVIGTTHGADWATVVFAAAPDTDGDGITDATDPDDDNDGLPDAWELANGFNPLQAADAALDTDGDTQPNSAEYIAGTDPRDRNSALVASLAPPPAPGSIAISFPAVAGRSYTVRYRTELGSGPYTSLQHFPAQPVSGPLTVVDTPPPTANRRFYEVVTPQQP